MQVDIGGAGIDNVFEDEDAFAANVLAETDKLVDCAGTLGAAVGGELHTGDAAREIEPFQQIDGKNDGPVEGDQHNRVIIAVFQHDVRSHPRDSIVDFFRRNVFDKCLVQKGHFFAHIHIFL